MNTPVENKIANANHLTYVELKTPLSNIDFGDKSSQIVFHDFIRHNFRGWTLNKQSEFGLFLAYQQGRFQARCFEVADSVIRDYNGASWKISKNGIYCIDAKKSDRFTVESPNRTIAECNPLEAGIVVTLMAIDKMMINPNDTFARAMRFYHHYLKTFIKEQVSAENPVIDADKISNLCN
jgi:hypothetical protein